MKKNIENYPIVSWDWNRFDTAIRILIDRLRDQKPSTFVGVLAIPNGGYIPAVCVSKKLGFHGKIKPIYDDSVMTEGKYVIVDEITDSGKTMKYVADRFPNSIYCTLAATGRAKMVLANKKFFTAEEISNIWITFPWEIPGEEKV